MLASDEVSYVSGATAAVTGGSRLCSARGGRMLGERGGAR